MRPQEQVAGLGDTRKREALFKGLHQVRGLLWDWTWRSPVWLDYEACAGRRQVPQEPTEHAWQGVGACLWELQGVPEDWRKDGANEHARPGKYISAFGQLPASGSPGSLGAQGLGLVV